MSFSTLVFGVVSFGAGVCAGIYMHEKGIVNCHDIRHGGEKLVAGARVVVTYVKRELTSENGAETSPAPAS